MIADDMFADVLPRVRCEIDEVRLNADALFLYSELGDERGQLYSTLRGSSSPASLLRVMQAGRGLVVVGDSDEVRPLASIGNAASILGDAHDIFVDITEMPVEIWAPIIAAAHLLGVKCTALYQEPVFYQPATELALGWAFDLTLSFSAPQSIPGFFTSQAEDIDERQQVLVAILGFEGQRLDGLIEHQLGATGSLVPVVGAPGYRPDYIFFALDANKLVLDHRTTPGDIVYANAACPFETFAALAAVGDAYRGARVQIAPLGTKPSTLGAILFGIAVGNQIDLVHDRAIRRGGAATGRGPVWMYHLHEFWQSHAFRTVRALFGG